MEVLQTSALPLGDGASRTGPTQPTASPRQEIQSTLDPTQPIRAQTAACPIWEHGRPCSVCALDKETPDEAKCDRPILGVTLVVTAAFTASDSPPRSRQPTVPPSKRPASSTAKIATPSPEGHRHAQALIGDDGFRHRRDQHQRNRRDLQTAAAMVMKITDGTSRTSTTSRSNSNDHHPHLHVERQRHDDRPARASPAYGATVYTSAAKSGSPCYPQEDGPPAPAPKKSPSPRPRGGRPASPKRARARAAKPEGACGRHGGRVRTSRSGRTGMTTVVRVEPCQVEVSGSRSQFPTTNFLIQRLRPRTPCAPLRRGPSLPTPFAWLTRSARSRLIPASRPRTPCTLARGPLRPRSVRVAHSLCSFAA